MKYIQNLTLAIVFMIMFSSTLQYLKSSKKRLTPQARCSQHDTHDVACAGVDPSIHGCAYKDSKCFFACANFNNLTHCNDNSGSLCKWSQPSTSEKAKGAVAKCVKK